MATLYEINRSIEEILDRLFAEADEETGEVPEEVLAELEQMQEARAEKLENIGCYIKNLKAEAMAIKAEMDALKKRLDQKKRKIDSLTEYVSNDLLLHEEKKFDSARVSYSFRKSERVSISDESALPKKFLIKEIIYKPDKTAIKEALKSGIKVRGAVLEENQNLQIK